jgi:hypothetical protein
LYDKILEQKVEELKEQDNYPKMPQNLQIVTVHSPPTNYDPLMYEMMKVKEVVELIVELGSDLLFVRAEQPSRSQFQNASFEVGEDIHHERLFGKKYDSKLPEKMMKKWGPLWENLYEKTAKNRENDQKQRYLAGHH